MKKKLVILSGLFVLLAVAAIYFSLQRRPSSLTLNPLEKIELSAISKISIENTKGKVDLEKSTEGWLIVSPVKDAADPSLVSEILENLLSFSAGSVISENPAKYSEFQIDDAQATHLQVYAEGKPEPVLNGYVGKNAMGYQSFYFRFSGSKPVYIAQGLPYLNREPKDYRDSRLFPVSVQEATAVKVFQDKFKMDIVKSSATWEHRFSSKTVDSALVTSALSKLERISVQDFGTGQENPKDLGLDKPFLVVTLEANTKTFTLTVGNKVKSSVPSAPSTRYAKTEGREAVLILDENSLNEFPTALKSFPK
ncbi:MAG: hypothetical protein KCHDKBKB_00084 [Elusimicrobia bacterium]|nr:hypothetical protein [Elusimicrobiota bacterium]